MTEQLVLDGSKLLWHRERLQAWLNGEHIAPITIDCALSSNCTYNCVYCYGKLQRMGQGNLPRDVVMRFLDEAAEIGVKAISFVSDGESACNPSLREAVLRGRANGLDMALGTNGYSLKDEDLPDMLPALTYLRFNISSATPEGYGKIHGVSAKCRDKVLATIRGAVEIKQAEKLPVTLGLQMVLMPEFAGEILPLARLGADLGVDYLVIKHCSDDEEGSLGVQYGQYEQLTDVLRRAEALSRPGYLVKAKWSKIMSGGKRGYRACYGPAFILQFSGSGLVAPCGMLFNDKYKRFHIGSLYEQSFKEMWQGPRWREVMGMLSAKEFDARHDCGSLCLQHKVNELLHEIVCEGKHVDFTSYPPPPTPCDSQPMHINFI